MTIFKKFHSYSSTPLIAIITASLIPLIFTLGIYILLPTSQANSAPLTQDPPPINNDLYLVVQGWDGMNNVLVLDQASGAVKQRFEAGYNVVVKLTANKRFLYLYSQSVEGEGGGRVSAIDTEANTTLWQVNIPDGTPFVESPRMGAWLSVDEKFLYLQGSPDGLHPHIFVVDTQTGDILNNFERLMTGFKEVICERRKIRISSKK